MRRLRPIISAGLIILTLLAAATAGAADATNPLWLQTGGLTYHHHPDGDRNNINLGLGLEYQYRPLHDLMGGVFQNSYYRTAAYVAYAWTPWEFWGVRAGVVAGLATGYATASVHGVRLGVLPSATWESRYFGMNFGLIPTNHGAVSVQFKFRL